MANGTSNLVKMTVFFDFIFHMDDWLQQIIILHPVTTYLLIFSFVYTESAFFPLAPFLPGDGLLFSIGVLGTGSFLHLWFAIPILIIAGILGTRTAFLLGRRTGSLLFKKISRLNQEHVDQAHAFYKKHGGMAFFLSRFIPVLRALVPLVAGIANMDNRQSWKYNIGSVSLWVLLITFMGYELGHLPLIKHYFGLIVLGASAMGLISLLLLGIRQQLKKKTKYT